MDIDRSTMYETSQIQNRKKIEERVTFRKGLWSKDEDSTLADYVNTHGEGHWDVIARCSGLKRSGKSCRFRWLNYLRPDIRHGNITLCEQLLILLLRSLWGNRWSKIAQQLPGRTDNEVKNYWRTRVEKQAKKLRLDVNSQEFAHTLRHCWIPQLLDQIGSAEADQQVLPISSTATDQGDQDGLLNPTTNADDHVQLQTGSSGYGGIAGQFLDYEAENNKGQLFDVEQSLDMYLGDLDYIDLGYLWPDDLAKESNLTDADL